MVKRKNRCSFCGRSEDEVSLLLSGLNGYICDDCVRQADKIVRENMGGGVRLKSGANASPDMDQLPKPRTILSA